MPKGPKVRLDGERVRKLMKWRKVTADSVYRALGAGPESARTALYYIAEKGKWSRVDVDQAANLAELLGVGTLELVRLEGADGCAAPAALETDMPLLSWLTGSGIVSRLARLFAPELERRARTMAGPYLHHVGGRWPARGFVGKQRIDDARPRFVRLRVERQEPAPLELQPELVPTPSTVPAAGSEALEWIEVWARRSPGRPPSSLSWPAYSLRLATIEWGVETGALRAIQHFSTGVPCGHASGDRFDIAIWAHPNGRSDGDVDEWLVAASFPFAVSLTEYDDHERAHGIEFLPATIVLPEAPHQRRPYQRPPRRQ